MGCAPVNEALASSQCRRSYRWGIVAEVRPRCPRYSAANIVVELDIARGQFTRRRFSVVTRLRVQKRSLSSLPFEISSTWARSIGRKKMVTNGESSGKISTINGEGVFFSFFLLREFFHLRNRNSRCATADSAFVVSSWAALFRHTSLSWFSVRTDDADETADIEKAISTAGQRARSRRSCR